MKVTNKKTFLKSKNDNPIYFMADTPHLMKPVRNNLIRKGIMYKNHLITKNPLIRLQSTSNFKIAFKLSSHMLYTTSLSAQKAKYATKLFSRSTSESWWFKIIQWTNLEDLECHPPCSQQLVRHFQFYCGEGWNRMAFGLANKTHDQMTSFTKELRVGKSLSFQRGILSNIESLILLHNYLRNKFGIKYIITKRLCQDPLELFFGKIRAMGSNDHPSS